MTQYYNILQNLWQELDLFSKVKRKCTKYSAHYCKLLKKECAFEFLMGHNKELDEVRGRVLGKEPMPSICKIFVEVQREKSQHKVMLGEPIPRVVENSTLAIKGFENLMSNDYHPGQ